MSKLKNRTKLKPKTKVKTSGLNKKIQPLKSGDLIDIIAPGSSVAPEVLQAGIAELKKWGYQVRCPDDLLSPQLFLANNDQKRFEFFKKSVTSFDSKAVWCLRGGYGSIRLLPMISKMKAPKNQKLFIGISDISSLHIYLNQKWNWPTLHAPLLDRVAQNKLTAENIKELVEVIKNPDYVTKFENLVPINSAAEKTKLIKSKIIGGNLTVVNSTIGTDFQIETENKILFLEELCERAYRVDRCLQQMKQAGVFEKVKAVVFGDFTDCHEPNKENLIPQTLKAFFQDLKIPAFTGLQVGHDLIQRPLFFNTEAHLTGGKKAQMLVYSPFK